MRTAVRNAAMIEIAGPRSALEGELLGSTPEVRALVGSENASPIELLARPIVFVDHPSYHDPSVIAGILEPFEEPDAEAGSSRVSVPRGLPAYLAGLYRVPLLSREQEAHLFRQMNCLKALAERIRRDAIGGRNSAASLSSARERIERLLKRANEIRARILRANQRLVVSIAKRFAGQTGDLFEMISDANLPLIEAVERFDFSRGYRFSTYATWAIRNGLIRSVAVERRRRERFVHGVDEIFDTVADHRNEAAEPSSLQKNPVAAIHLLLARLTDRERVVLVGRYGLDGARQKSLRQIGSQIGVSKERARQIEIAAREKLRRFAAGLSLGPIPA